MVAVHNGGERETLFLFGNILYVVLILVGRRKHKTEKVQTRGRCSSRFSEPYESHAACTYTDDEQTALGHYKTRCQALGLFALKTKQLAMFYRRWVVCAFPAHACGYCESGSDFHINPPHFI